MNPRARERAARRRLSIGALVLGAWLLAVGVASAASEPPAVTVLTATGTVDQVLAGYLEEGVAAAARDGSDAVVIQLNTPGGSLDATNEIVSTLLESPVPVIVWVAPAGGYAASAGTFITLASNVAFMAPGESSRRLALEVLEDQRAPCLHPVDDRRGLLARRHPA